MLRAAVFFIAVLACGDAAAACRWIEGYYRQDGTYVKRYERCDGRSVSGGAGVPAETLAAPSSPELDRVVKDAARLTPSAAAAPPPSIPPAPASGPLIMTVESEEERKIWALVALIGAVAALFWLIWYVTGRAAKATVDLAAAPFLLTGQWWRRRADEKAARAAAKAAAIAAAQEEKRRRAEEAAAKRAAMVGALGGLLRRKKPPQI